jgi:AraC family transcriptional regulator
MTQNTQKHLILVGADDPLPAGHVWFDGDGFSIYMAIQPRSTWQEHAHDCVQVTVGLEPAHMQAEWRSGPKPHQSKEFIGNAVSVIPANVPHRTFWQRRAALIHIYIHQDGLLELGRDLLKGEAFELQPTYLIRDLLIEELARSLYLQSDNGGLSGEVARAAVVTISARLLMAYTTSPKEQAQFIGGLGPARERRIRKYIEKDLERDLSLQALANVVDLSPQHFAVLFRSSTGFTPHQYVNHRRIARSQELLASGDLMITEIALQCGFSSQSQFITTFRKLVGVTPGKFRSSLIAAKV